MASFPALKTGAVAQYPADRATRHSTQVYRFVDGTEQRFPQYGTALKAWAIRLGTLTEQELTTLEDFFMSVAGRPDAAGGGAVVLDMAGTVADNNIGDYFRPGDYTFKVVVEDMVRKTKLEVSASFTLVAPEKTEK